MNELFRKLLFLPEQGSQFARDVDLLHYFVIFTTMFGALLVTGVGGYFLFRYRRGRYGHGDDEAAHVRYPAPTKGIPIALELAVIVGLLALFLTWWVIGFRQYVRARVAPEHSRQVYVVAKKWMWKFAYPEGGGSVGVLTVPVDQPIQLVMTSRDVIHSFYVPAFRIKQDIVPGRYTTAWFQADKPGVYDLMCTEYCGTGHSTMRGQVVVLESDDYARWIEGAVETPVAGQDYQPPSVLGGESPSRPVDLVTMGRRKAAEHGCLRCHSVDGAQHIGPTFAGLYGSTSTLTDGTTVAVDDGYITQSMMDPQRRVRQGFKPVMPTYRGLQPGDTTAILAYIKSLRDVPHEPVEQQRWP